MRYLNKLLEESSQQGGLTPAEKRGLKYAAGGAAAGIAYSNREAIGNKLDEWGEYLRTKAIEALQHHESTIVESTNSNLMSPHTKKNLKYGAAGAALGVGGSYAYHNREAIGNKLSEWEHDIKDKIRDLVSDKEEIVEKAAQ